MRCSRSIKRVIGRISRILKKKSPLKNPRKRIAGSRPKSLPQTISQIPALPRLSAISSLNEFSELQLSPNTQRAYRKDLQDFFGWLKTQDFWENWNQNLGPSQIAQYREHLRVERNLSKGTVTRRLAVLKSFFKYACARG